MTKVRWYAILLAAVAFAGAASVAGVALGDDRATASALLDQLDHDAAHKGATAATVQRARDAMERATRMRASGDEAHAALADGLARQYAESGRDLVRALEAERTANEARLAATDAGTLGDRERALLEEGIARNGRLRVEIEEIARPHAETKTSHLATSDAGAPPPKTTPAAKSDGGAPR